MNQKKNKKLIIIAIVIIAILIIGIGIAYTFVATDMFKSDKKMFFKYISQATDEKKGFVNNDVVQYFEKRKNTPYETNGTISFNIESLTNEDEIDNINNTNITLKGKVDKVNNKENQEIDINYSEDVKLPFIYQKDGDLIGIQTDYIGSKYIGSKIEKFGELFDEDNMIIDKLKNMKISDEELKTLKDTYYKVIEQELYDRNFSTIKEGKGKAYQLTLTREEIKNILIKLFETLNNDQETLDKMNEYIGLLDNSSKITKSDIEEIIEALNDSDDFEDLKLQITVHVENKKLTKIEIDADIVKLVIEKQESGNSKQYNFSLEIKEDKDDDESIKIYLNARYSGLQSLQTITEDYELGIITGSENYVYYYNNEVNFVDNVDIEDFDDDNIMILTDYNEEQATTLQIAITERMVDVNKFLMERLGLTENENPLIYATPLTTLFTSGLNATTINNNMDNLSVSTFNEKFEAYEGTNKGFTVKGLLSTIQNSNETEENKIQEVNFDGEEYESTEENITLIKSEIESDTDYEIGFEKDEDSGMIFRVVINKK